MIFHRGVTGCDFYFRDVNSTSIPELDRVIPKFTENNQHMKKTIQ